MYKDYFGLKEEPFSIAPDPEFLYMSERHREALGHLIYGMKTNGGFVLLTGEVGTGKTTVCRCLLEQIPEDAEVAFVVNPRLTVVELLETLCDELRIDYPTGNQSNKLLIDAINRFLLEAHSKGRKTLLIIDEAQNLSCAVLEQIRLLTNLETNKQKLLQVIMLGQPELKLMLAQPDMRQFAQRITARYHLEPLAQSEIKSYIDHRLSVAGGDRRLFPAPTINKLYQLSGGIPRLINLLCDRALLGAYVRGEQQVSPKLLTEAGHEVFGEQLIPRKRTALVWRLIFAVGVVISGSLLLMTNLKDKPQPLVTTPVAMAEVAPVEGDRLEWDGQLIAQSDSLAYQALFNLWDIIYHPGRSTAIEQASRQGLSLGTKRGSLGQLRQLNRPAVLKLKNRTGQTYYATLTTLTDETASLTLGPQYRNVSISDLSAQWYGDFSLLWQAPSGYQSSVKPGDRGKQVRWLDQQMATLYGRSPDTEDDLVFRGKLLEEVRQFQTSQGLEPDGVVGTYTLIHLNNTTSDRQPTLVAVPKG